MKKHPETRRPGRPRSPANTELVAALIARQDAMARRTQRRIADFLARHVLVSEVEQDLTYARGVVAESLLALPSQLAPRIATMTSPEEIHRLLSDEIRSVLICASHRLRGAATDDQAPSIRPPRPRRSRTLAQARAQNARLGAVLIDLTPR